MSVVVAGSSTKACVERALGSRLRSFAEWPYPYATSHPLVAFDAELEDGRTVAGLVKEPGSSHGSGPACGRRSVRERAAYELVSAVAVAPRLLGAAAGRLVLERLEGDVLWQRGDVEAWCAAARTARVLHDGLRASVGENVLLRYDRAFYEHWLHRARSLAGPLVPVERVHAAAAERLLAEPQVVIHGELYPSNVVVAAGRAFFVDWETAGAGPAVVDLAALTSGLPEHHAGAAIAAYGAVDPVALDCARLHLSLRWLGWAAGWQPPSEHVCDWRREAFAVAGRLEESLG